MSCGFQLVVMSECKRPRLERGPKLDDEAKLTFVRYFARCFRSQKQNVNVLKENLLKFTLISQSSLLIMRSVLRNFWLQNRIGWEFEWQLENGKGPRIRYPDQITYSLLDLIKPVDFRLCGHFGDVGNFARINHLIARSTEVRHLVAYKPTHEENFILLLQSMASHLDNLECDPKFLNAEDVPLLKLKCFKSSPTRGQVPLRDILLHKITCLDLSNDAPGAASIVDDECPTQDALTTLVVRGSVDSINESLLYFLDVQAFAKNLKHYEVKFNEETSPDETTKFACKLVDKIQGRCRELMSFAEKCRPSMKTLVIKSGLSAELTEKTTYENNWLSQLNQQSLDCDSTKTSTQNTAYGREETFEITKRDAFLTFEFKAKLIVTTAWNDDFLFGRLS
ncbi:hypothetical protein M3Y98_00967700 [Aphelenchoides besseyi]|nr:hypothetical protein M3Y98_00967700 [Aphelenchoides besseyi]